MNAPHVTPLIAHDRLVIDVTRKAVARVKRKSKNGAEASAWPETAVFALPDGGRRRIHTLPPGFHVPRGELGDGITLYGCAAHDAMAGTASLRGEEANKSKRPLVHAPQRCLDRLAVPATSPGDTIPLDVATDAKSAPKGSTGARGGDLAQRSPDGIGEAPGTVGSVPFMITTDMKRRLRELGYTADQIFNMRPAEAHAAIAAATPRPRGGDGAPDEIEPGNSAEPASTAELDLQSDTNPSEPADRAASPDTKEADMANPRKNGTAPGGSTDNVVRLRPNPKLEAAFDLARRGFSIFPLVPNKKTPVVENWQNIATTDPERIRKCWSEDPNRNIGVPTQNYIVVDVDPRNGGHTTFDELVLTEDFPETAKATTQGGGNHIFYKLPEGTRVRGGINLFGPGIDIKSWGGYVVAAGSTIDGRAYKWDNDLPVAPAPPWLIERCTAARGRSIAAGKRIVDEDDTAVELARKYMDRQPAVEVGVIDDTEYKHAAKCYDFGCGTNTVEELLTEWCMRWDIPTSEDRLRVIVASAGRNRENAIGCRHPLASGFEAVEIDESKNPLKQTTSTNQPWDTAVDLWADAAEPMDLSPGVLPHALERWVADEAERKGVDVGVMAVPAVVMCAAAASAQFRIQVKQFDTGHTDCAVLWGAIVGAPGARKTPVLKAAMAPIETVERKWAKQNQCARKDYETQLRAWKKDTKNGSLAREPIRPRERRKIVQDTTIESVCQKLADNPSGLLCYNDELAQWAGNMDAYRPGKAVSRDQGYWLQAKGGGRYVVDRVSRETPDVEVNAVHVVGGIQPDVISRLAPQWGGNGVMQRFLLVLAKPARLSLDRAPDKYAEATIFEAVQLIMDLEWSPFVPQFRFSPEADGSRQKIVSFAHGLINDSDTPLPLRGWLEKLEGEWARLSLVFHFIEWATGLGALGIEDFPPELIPGDTAARAARFLVEFQYPHQVAFYRSVGLGLETESDAMWVAGHILSSPAMGEITERDIDRAYLKGPTKRAARLQAMEALETANWVRPSGTHRREGHVNRWSINPAVRDGRFAARAAIETARRKSAMEGIAASAEARRALIGSKKAGILASVEARP